MNLPVYGHQGTEIEHTRIARAGLYKCDEEKRAKP